MTRRLRLLLLAEYFPARPGAITGGVETRAYNLATRLARRGHEVTVICTRQPGAAREQRMDGVRVLRAGPVQGYTNTGNVFMRLFFAIAAFLRGRRIPADVVEGCSFLAYVPAGLIGRTTGRPALATYHETWIGEWLRHKGFWVGLCGELWERLAFLLPWDRIIAVSRYTKDRLLQRGARAPITVIPNGIAPMPPAVLRTRKSAVPLVSCVSRLVPGKRVDVLIRALAIARKDVPGLRAVIVGQGGERARLERLAETLGLADAVTFTGRVADITEVYRTIASSQAFCLPSEVEGFGIAVLEAMACGVPVACSDIPPLREVTRDGKGSLLFPVGDADALAQALVRLLTDRPFAHRKQAEAKRLAASYGWDGITGQVEMVYRSLARPAEA